jgi:hypothetical protein
MFIFRQVCTRQLYSMDSLQIDRPIVLLWLVPSVPITPVGVALFIRVHVDGSTATTLFARTGAVF